MFLLLLCVIAYYYKLAVDLVLIFFPRIYCNFYKTIFNNGTVNSQSSLYCCRPVRESFKATKCTHHIFLCFFFFNTVNIKYYNSSNIQIL